MEDAAEVQRGSGARREVLALSQCQPENRSQVSVASDFRDSCHIDATDQAGQGTPCDTSKDPKWEGHLFPLP